MWRSGFAWTSTCPTAPTNASARITGSTWTRTLRPITVATFSTIATIWATIAGSHSPASTIQTIPWPTTPNLRRLERTRCALPVTTEKTTAPRGSQSPRITYSCQTCRYTCAYPTSTPNPPIILTRTLFCSADQAQTSKYANPSILKPPHTHTHLVDSQ